ncbi:MAG: N-acetylmuramoyl-L-alanine amidase [Ignavibacteria bacterium]|nr:N-acetylmuramoyl-L-alanine amidase [Ignavibacteria bacterium]
MKIRIIFGLLIAYFAFGFCVADAADNVSAVAQKGSGVLGLLGKYKLSKNMNNIELFQRLNSGSFDKNGGLLLGTSYQLPIRKVVFNGNNIRTTLNIKDYDLAKQIEDYNVLVENAKIKKGSFKQTKELWVPYELLMVDSAVLKNNEKRTESKKEQAIDYSYLKEQASSPKVDNVLSGFAFYLISGHGGPDPGAVGKRDGNDLNEHEYAYDVTIRLAKKLKEHGADVYMIVQDEKDGIRETQYLKAGGNEKLINGDAILPGQLDRLKQRTDIVNDYVAKNKKKYKEQLLLEIHVDSRITKQRIDIFFYHRAGSKSSERLNNTLFKTIEEKYNKAQPGRGYKGNVTSRDLWTLRNTTIDASFIELGNIQNPADQLRFIQPDNRQAIANWLYEGIIKHYK